MNALPDCVLEHILGFLPAAEAVQTCVLARRWRHLWKSATSLHIGDVGEPVRKLREFVYHLLLLRRGEVCDFYFDGFDEKDVPRVNLWFRYAVACNVRLLSLNALPPEGSGRRFLQLEDLPLVSQKLRIIDLKFVRVNSTFLDFSGCPALKHLQFEFSEFSLSSETMTTISSESLVHLSIVDSDKLRTLTLNEYWCVSNDIGALACILERSPVLEKLTLQLFSEGYGHKIEMKGSFSSMERSSAVSEHLEEVIIKCDVVDERILEVLKFLCAFNIQRLTRIS
ncbi:hypothetical protein EJB05_36974, partial [Eragrostis curvula]